MTIKTKPRANDFDRHIGQRIKARRKELKLTQKYLADRIGVTFQQVQKYERGTNRVAVGTLCDISQALDARIDYFILGYIPKPA